MDRTTDSIRPHYRMEGFARQRLCVLPRPLVNAAQHENTTRRLVVTDAGYYPSASGHRMMRPKGASETIVILCVAGSGTVSIGEAVHTLTPSACTAIPAQTPHAYAATDDDPWSIWWMHVRGTDVEDLTAPLRRAHLTRLRSLDRVVALFDELVGLLEGRLSPAQILAASGVAWHLLTRICADSLLPVEGSPLERAMGYLESRVDSHISVGELASLVGMSPSHLSALFRDATGGGPAAFHTSMKMARARMLLDTTDKAISEVAATVGYTDPLYFSRQFRRVHGVNPSAYRAQHKG